MTKWKPREWWLLKKRAGVPLGFASRKAAIGFREMWPTRYYGTPVHVREVLPSPRAKKERR